jgi:hypothetical protein
VTDFVRGGVDRGAPQHRRRTQRVQIVVQIAERAHRRGFELGLLREVRGDRVAARSRRAKARWAAASDAASVFDVVHGIAAGRRVDDELARLEEIPGHIVLGDRPRRTGARTSAASCVGDERGERHVGHGPDRDGVLDVLRRWKPG